MPYGGKRELAKEFQVSDQAVYDALNFKTNSAIAKAIRERALQENGLIIETDETAGDFENE